RHRPGRAWPRRRRRPRASGRAAPRSGVAAASDGGGVRLGPAGNLHAQHLVRAGVALGEEPQLATEPVLPPLALDAGHVSPEVDVVRELAEARRAPRPCRHLTRVGELVDVPFAAVRTGEKKRDSGLQRIADPENVLRPGLVL